MEIKYGNWTLDSEEELYFVYWLEELLLHGYIKSFDRVESSIPIFDKVNFKFFISKNGKAKEIEKFILHPLKYTPDFIIEWNKKADGKLVAIRDHTYTKEDFDRCYFYCEEDMRSLIDVKGTFASAKLISAITFPIIQKILLYNGTFIQKIEPFNKTTGLFAKTFTPASYLFTKTGKQRKINWKVTSVDNFLK